MSVKAGQAHGGLLVGAMGAILWAARRGQAPPTAQPAPATSSPASVESQGSQLLAKPTSALSRARSNVSWLLGVAVSIGFAGGGPALWPGTGRPGQPRRSGSGRNSFGVLHPGWPTPSGAWAAEGHARGGAERRFAAPPQAAEHDASRRAGQGRRHGVTTWRRMPVRGRPGGPRGSGCCQPPGRGIRPRAHPERIGRGTALSAVGPGRPGVGPALARIEWTMCLASLSMPGRNPDDMA
jgi:hypothetical protein